MNPHRNPPGRACDRLDWMVFAVLVGPFYLNDFAGICLTDWRAWLAIDYAGVKLLPLAVMFWLVRGGRIRPDELGLRKQRVGSFLLVFLVAALAGTVIDQNGYRLAAALPGYRALGAMPAIPSPAWEWLDLTAGLLAVGVVEELVFRGYMRACIERFTRRPLAIVAISSVAFGLIHWSLGLHAVLVTTAIGAVFMAVYLRSGALAPLMLAHFAVNFIDFAGVVPKSIFRLP